MNHHDGGYFQQKLSLYHENELSQGSVITVIFLFIFKGIIYLISTQPNK